MRAGDDFQAGLYGRDTEIKRDMGNIEPPGRAHDRTGVDTIAVSFPAGRYTGMKI